MEKPNIDYKRIGEIIRNRRIELGLTQEELAKKLGYSSRSSINKVELGRPISQKIIFIFAKELGISFSYLMELEKNEHLLSCFNNPTHLKTGNNKKWLNYEDYTEDERKEIQLFANFLISKRKDDKQ